MNHDLHTFLLAAAAGLLIVLGVWATNRLLDRGSQGRSLPGYIRRETFTEPLPVLDDQPPHYAIHVANPADPPTTCSCHGNPFADGDRILIWPYEALLCKDTYGRANFGSEDPR